MIRHAKKEEIVIIREWLQETAHILQHKGVQQWRQFLQYENTEIIVADFMKEYLYVFVTGQDQPVASLSLCLQEEWDHRLWNDRKEAYYIHRLVVSKRGKGLHIGSQLIEWAKQKAREEGRLLRLDCIANNEFLRMFYDRQGLSFVREKEGFALFERDERVSSNL